jgi:hypothetical protein
MKKDKKPKPGKLSFKALQKANLKRCSDPNGFNHPLDGWSELEWAGAMCGEAGEAANVAKKISRAKLNVRGNKKGERELPVLYAKCAAEYADTIIYAVLGLSRLGFDAGEAVRDRFNEKSQEIGYGEYI